MNKNLLAWNRGRISPLALARADFKRTELSAEVMTNWMPRKLGSMMLRPGMGYTGASNGNAFSVSLPFIASTADTARIELTNLAMRVWVGDALVTRPAVTSAITNGTFGTNLTGWADVDESTSTSAWATGGYLSLTGTGSAAARRRQQVSTVETGVRHALNIVIKRGPVELRVGSTAGGDDYIAQTTLRTGSHSLAFTPTGDFWIDLFGYKDYAALVDSIAVAPAGTMLLAAPWIEADLRAVRSTQSIDVLFAACSGYRQRRIERRATDSWSVVEYSVDDGPFQTQNIGPITLTPSAVTGDTTLTASADFFQSGHVGALFRLTQSGQTESATLTGDNQFTNPIRIVGTSTARTFAVSVSGTWAGIVTLQYSVAAPGDWIDAPQGMYTSNIALGYDDTLDNQIFYYRIGIKTGDYTSGTADVILSSPLGEQTGICRVTAVTNPTTASVAVLSEFGTIDATTTWYEGAWSDVASWPADTALYEGRLWWFGNGWSDGSISDAYESFDDTVIGDSAPIRRSIGEGPADAINWAQALGRLILATDGTVWSAQSSNLDEPLTALNFNLKGRSSEGAAAVNSVQVDTSAIFVQRNGTRIYEAGYEPTLYDYTVNDLSTYVPEIGEPGVVRLAVQRQPETRIHAVRSNGTVGILVLDKAENVSCWLDYETAGDVTDICVLPGTIEDQVYYTIKRTINGATVYYHEKWSLESECIGGTLNKQLDAFVSASGSGASITGLSHLEGAAVKCWADGVYKGNFTVSGGSIAQAYTTGYVVGLSYEATYKSAKLLYASPDGSFGLCMRKRIDEVGIVAQNMHPLALTVGSDFDHLDNLPATEAYDPVDTDTIWAQYDNDPFAIPGEWTTDSRLCMKATAPYPVTLLAAVVGMTIS